jgi:hypothetical protein
MEEDPQNVINSVRFTLPSGHRLELSSLHITMTPRVFDNLPKLREEIEEIAKRVFPGWKPVILLPNGKVDNHLCLAIFHSGKPIDQDTDAFGSHVLLCWTVANISRPVRELACQGLAHVDWDDSATNWYWS